MAEIDIDDAIDSSFPDDSSIDSFDSSGDSFDVMDTVEVPTFEETSFDDVESSSIEDYSLDDTEILSDEVDDIMGNVEMEELTFDDEIIEDVSPIETLENTIEQPIEGTSFDSINAMEDVESEVLEFDDQKSYEATPNSEIEILQEDGIVDPLENIQEQLEAEPEAVEQVEAVYEATPNSEVEILQEDGTVDTLENIQEQLEAEPEAVEQVEVAYEATPNSEVEILQEDGTVDTLENIQEQLETEPEAVEQVEAVYEATPNSDVEILQEDGTVDTLENIQEQLETEPEAVEQVEVAYEATTNSEIEILQENGTVDALENMPDKLDPHVALSNMNEYLSSHNYGRDDFDVYSKDPEWQALNRELQIANGYDVPELGNTDNEIPELNETSELGDWIKEINPNFDPFDWESPFNNNCGSCAYAVYRRLEGDTDIVATAENIGYNSQMEALTGMEQVSMSPEEIENRLLEQGDGAHAIIGIDRAEGPGHWFNAACIDGKVVTIDGQSGEISDWPPDYGNVVNWEMSIKKDDVTMSNHQSFLSRVQNFFKR